jgi:hypothetical protein
MHAHGVAAQSSSPRSLFRSVLFVALLLSTSCGGGEVWGAEEDAMKPQFYLQQVQDAMPLKTMRGVWRYKEQREGQVFSHVLPARFHLSLRLLFSLGPSSNGRRGSTIS